LALGDKVYKLGVEKTEVEKKLEAEQKARASLKKSAEALAADGQELEKQLSEARRLLKEAEERAMTAESKVMAAEKDLQRAKAENDENMAAADSNGYERGKRETLQQFAQEANENEEKAFGKGYLLGRADCWPEAFGHAYNIIAVPADSALRSSIPPVPETVVPEMPFEDEDEVPEGDDAERGAAVDLLVGDPDQALGAVNPDATNAGA
jgi:hypothetical protein